MSGGFEGRGFGSSIRGRLLRLLRRVEFLRIDLLAEIGTMRTRRMYPPDALRLLAFTCGNIEMF